MLVALKLQHGVHDVLQHFRAGQRAVFGDVTDEYDAGAAPFDVFQQRSGAFPDLRETARRRLHRLRRYGLYGVDDDQIGLLVFDVAVDALQRGLRQQQQVVSRAAAQTLRSQLDLAGALLTGDVEHLHALQPQDGLQHQRALADAGLAAQQTQAAGHQSAAEHAVELFVAQVDAHFAVHRDVAYGRRCVAGIAPPGRSARQRDFLRSNLGFAELLHRVPLTAGGTASQPLRTLLPAFRADIHRLSFCHTFDTGRK